MMQVFRAMVCPDTVQITRLVVWSICPPLPVMTNASRESPGCNGIMPVPVCTLPVCVA